MNNLLRQTITYWAPGSPDHYGQRTPAAPAAVLGRWEERAELFIDQAGAERRSVAVVYLRSDVELGGWLALGDQTGTADPRSLAAGTAWEVRQFSKIPDGTGTRYLRKAML